MVSGIREEYHVEFKSKPSYVPEFTPISTGGKVPIPTPALSLLAVENGITTGLPLVPGCSLESTRKHFFPLKWAPQVLAIVPLLTIGR
jgi:hypothetical protein